ncbi:SDR family NAD(P)-dependent oxidoreductase [Azoarcus sp. DN11]|uniref:SDR family NAD(P)-dependent oxidoreductase n=1 Tax=Azoarcus sp. DN11 TaxID=356837 RepID=UPI000EB4BE57|nr:SDR family NAD(P)-dependent oxidoreductase [Azoarcus sp. DN11]AYH45082.1 short-chain dehydrogenase/reductase SDR [Azoarcus sp. DN11]
MIDFDGKTAVITGAGSGMGEAMAWRFAREGMKIVVADIDAAAAKRVSDALQAAGHRALPVRCDVASPEEVEALAVTSFETFGSVDLLCNNAGIVPSGRFRPVWEYPLEDWKWSFDVNMMGVAHGLRSFVPRMLAQGTEGHIVTTASVAGLVSGSGSAVYSAAKFAAVRITEALYASLQELGAPIGVTVLCPGLVNTKIYQSERNRPQELRPDGGAAEETEELKAIAANLYAGAISPADVAEQVIGAVRANQLYLLTTDKFDEAIETRMRAILDRANPTFAGLLELTKRDLRDEGEKAA